MIDPSCSGPLLSYRPACSLLQHGATAAHITLRLATALRHLRVSPSRILPICTLARPCYLISMLLPRGTR